MRIRASSSRTDPRPWYRERWPWLLFAGPSAVVVASLATAWIAAASDDGVVAQDYYRQGLLINRKLRLDPVPVREPGATIALSRAGELRVRLEGVAQPSRLELKLAQPGGHDIRIVVLAPVAEGDWTGALPDLGAGRRIVTLESEAWRMPVTTTGVPFSEIRLGAAAGHGS